VLSLVRSRFDPQVVFDEIERGEARALPCGAVVGAVLLVLGSAAPVISIHLNQGERRGLNSNAGTPVNKRLLELNLKGGFDP
jgi:hypothetical protein